MESKFKVGDVIVHRDYIYDNQTPLQFGEEEATLIITLIFNDHYFIKCKSKSRTHISAWTKELVDNNFNLHRENLLINNFNNELKELING